MKGRHDSRRTLSPDTLNDGDAGRKAVAASLSPAIRDFLDVVAGLLVRDVLTYSEGDAGRAPETHGDGLAGGHEC